MTSLGLSLGSWTWFGLALILFVLEGVRPGRFALWLGFAAVLIGMVASVARWPWPVQVAALVVLGLLMIPVWRRYERKA
jgi:membrane protein implicated in regulation of membrane protease activity